MAARASGSATAADSFAELGGIKYALNHMLLPKLKLIAREMNESSTLPWTFALTIRKGDLIQRLQTTFETAVASKSYAHYQEGKRIVEKHYQATIDHRSPQLPPQYNTGPPAFNASSYPVPPYHQAHGAYPVSGGHVGRYANPYTAMHGVGASSLYQANRPGLPVGQMSRPGTEVISRMGTFIESPFYSILSWVTSPVLVPPSNKAVARLKFQLGQKERDTLRDPKSGKQLRLFCTTRPACQASMDGRHPAPVEFPIYCDLRVRSLALAVNVRGRKTPAKVLPPNLNTGDRLDLASGKNEVELIYATTSHTYVLAAAMCQMVTPEELADRVKENRVKSKETVVMEMKKAADDDDIEVGDVTLQLKCPLSYGRLVLPSRSDICAHNQCFDALSFFMFNEQTPNWQCPICVKTINPKTLFIDGYVLDILQRVPEDEDAVNIDSAGRWRTLDNKYRSDAVASTSNAATGANNEASGSEHAGGLPRVKGEAQTTPTPGQGGGSMSRSNSHSNSNKAPFVEVFDLDDTPSPSTRPSTPRVQSDDVHDRSALVDDSTTTMSNGDTAQNHSTDSNPIEARGLGLAAKQAHAASSSSARASGVIDLTLSDSEDDEPPPPRRTTTAAAPSRPSGDMFGAANAELQSALRRSMWEAHGARGNLPSNVQPLDRFLVPTNAAARAPSSLAAQAPTRASRVAPVFLANGVRSISDPPAQAALATSSQGPSQDGVPRLAHSASFSSSGAFTSWGAMSTGPFATASAIPTAAALPPPSAVAAAPVRAASATPALLLSSASAANLPAMASSSDLTVEDTSFRQTARAATETATADQHNGAHAQLPNNGTASTTTAINNPGRRRTYEEREDDDTEDEDEPIVRPHKRTRVIAGTSAIFDQVDEYDAEFEDMDFEDFELDPAAGFGGGSKTQSGQPVALNRSEGGDGLAKATTSGADAGSTSSNTSATPAAQTRPQRSRDSTLSELSIDERAGLAPNGGGGGGGGGSSVTADSD